MSARPFLASAAFAGPREGYVYRNGPHGLGYYAEPAPALGQSVGIDLPEVPEGEDIYDEAQAQQLVKQLARLSRANLEMRAKYARDPSKFMASEVALDEHLNKMSALATRPDLMGKVAAPLVEELAPLVAHENETLVRDVVGLLRELTDSDNFEGETREIALAFVDALMDAEVPASIVTCIDRAPLASLEVLSNLCEIYPTAGPEHVARKTKALPWLLNAAKEHASQDVSLAASELLAVLLTGSEFACAVVGTQENMDALLVAAARWRKKEPASALESEWRENVWDVLGLAVQAGAHDIFGKLEGVELALKMLPATVAARALEFATASSASNCARVVEAGGLGALFSMLKAKEGKKRARGEDAIPHVLAVLASLQRWLTKGGLLRERVDRKLSEEGKIERLVELRRGLCERVNARVSQLEDEGEEEQGEDENPEDEKYLARLEAGLESIQNIDMVLASVWESLGGRARTALDAGGMSADDIKAVLVERASREEGEDMERLVLLADMVK